MVLYLLSKGADIESKNNNGNTALNLAREKGHKETVDLLLSHAASSIDQGYSVFLSFDGIVATSDTFVDDNKGVVWTFHWQYA